MVGLKNRASRQTPPAPAVNAASKLNATQPDQGVVRTPDGVPEPSGSAAETREHGTRTPASADLVEHFETGKLYLRAYVQGRYIWQPVEAEDPRVITATGAWIVDNDLQEAYWLNHGTYRRRAGKFHAVDQQAPAA